MTGLAVPQPTSLAEVDTLCASIEHWAEGVEDISQLLDATNKLAAINEYLERTSTDGRARVSAAIRRVEVRIGEVMPREQGKRTDLEPLCRDREVPIDKSVKTDFRVMAEHPDVVEDVIEASTDEDPPTRRKVMRAIRANGERRTMRPGVKQQRAAARRELVADLHRQGHTIPSIASRLDVSESTVSNDIKALGIGRGRGSKPVRAHEVIEQVTLQVSGLTIAINSIDQDDLEVGEAEAARWLGDLDRAIKSLNNLRKQIREKMM